MGMKRAHSLQQISLKLSSHLSGASRPSSIYISLYSRWPTFYLEDAIAALNSAWHDITDTSEASYNFYRSDSRILFILAEICLVVCAFRVRLTLKNGAIIVFGYFAAAVGSKSLIDALAQGESRFTLGLKIGVFILIAVLFPLLVTWSPKDVFTVKDNNQNEET